jgi:pimeloyl-ACP methyl ester carboxylesterase
MRSESFPYEERYAYNVSPLGPICYFDTGDPPGDDEPAPPVVLIHALGTNMTQWEHVAPLLARYTRVLGLDLPGCGHSAKPRHQYSLALMAQAVRGLLEYLKIPRAVLLGHSYGGMVATQVALNHPHRVASLVLMNSSGFTRYPAWAHLLMRMLFRPVIIAPLVQLVVGSILRTIFTTHNEHTERFIRSVLDRRSESRYAWDFAHYATPMLGDIMSHVLDRLHELKLPVLVIWGEKDGLLPHRAVSDWVGQLANARLVTIPCCGHMPNLEYPDVVASAVADFIHRLERGVTPVAAQAQAR